MGKKIARFVVSCFAILWIAAGFAIPIVILYFAVKIIRMAWCG